MSRDAPVLTIFVCGLEDLELFGDIHADPDEVPPGYCARCGEWDGSEDDPYAQQCAFCGAELWTDGSSDS